MRINKSWLRPIRTPLQCFASDKVISEGAISLSVTAGEGRNQVTLLVDFLVVNTPSAYNAILGRPSLNSMRAVVSTYHLMMKFPALGGIEYLRGDQREGQRCYSVAFRKGVVKQALTVNMLDPRERTLMLDFLKQHRDVFAYTHHDMSGIPLEVSKLLGAGFIEEIHYPDWIANVVLMKKANGKWRVCVDYSDLNKACPNDSLPLPRIDQLVDSTAKHELFTFMDAYSGYNQIVMYPPDR
ncbi:uncharacterized protein LOC131244036 [Magnolia sinica]|uniref:uncharacterized protein LOC131244036 n=1 Tax=Magnolia sinica TaxID=86752 RepID=UPI002658E2D5|nr:uncharacterized protein LOC131244036 [Magnolia sinica]